MPYNSSKNLYQSFKYMYTLQQPGNKISNIYIQYYIQYTYKIIIHLAQKTVFHIKRNHHSSKNKFNLINKKGFSQTMFQGVPEDFKVFQERYREEGVHGRSMAFQEVFEVFQGCSWGVQGTFRGVPIDFIGISLREFQGVTRVFQEVPGGLRSRGSLGCSRVFLEGSVVLQRFSRDFRCLLGDFGGTFEGFRALFRFGRVVDLRVSSFLVQPEQFSVIYCGVTKQWKDATLIRIDLEHIIPEILRWIYASVRLFHIIK